MPSILKSLFNMYTFILKKCVHKFKYKYYYYNGFCNLLYLFQIDNLLLLIKNGFVSYLSILQIIKLVFSDKISAIRIIIDIHFC